MVDWTPFEERPRPAGLGRVVLGLNRLRRIEITSDSEEDIGEVFAWLLGQAHLSRQQQNGGGG
jgi:hypothetical protein